MISLRNREDLVSMVTRELLFRIRQTSLSKRLYSVYLIGSAARGELSFLLSPSGFDVHGDIEYLFVFRGSVKRKDKRILSKILQDIEQYLNIKSPFFHIDYGAYSRIKMRFLPNTFWFQELFNNGQLVYGQSDTDLFRTILRRRYDLGNLNRIIIVRLWNMLRIMPDKIKSDELSEYEKELVAHSYARNILDILTVYMPNKGYKLFTYKSRLKAYQNLDLDDRLWKVDLFRECLDIKLGNTRSTDYERLGLEFLEAYQILFQYLRQANPRLGTNFTRVVFRELLYKRTRRFIKVMKLIFNTRRFDLRLLNTDITDFAGITLLLKAHALIIKAKSDSVETTIEDMLSIWGDFVCDGEINFDEYYTEIVKVMELYIGKGKIYR